MSCDNILATRYSLSLIYVQYIVLCDYICAVEYTALLSSQKICYAHIFMIICVRAVESFDNYYIVVMLCTLMFSMGSLWLTTFWLMFLLWLIVWFTLFVVFNFVSTKKCTVMEHSL